MPGVPTSIVVGPFKYSVQVGGEAFQKASFERRAELFGHCDHLALRITLRPDMAHDAMCETLMHEVLHACSNATGQPLGEMDHDNAEENACGVLASPLLQTLRANPDLVAFLTQ